MANKAYKRPSISFQALDASYDGGAASAHQLRTSTRQANSIRHDTLLNEGLSSNCGCRGRVGVTAVLGFGGGRGMGGANATPTIKNINLNEAAQNLELNEYPQPDRDNAETVMPMARIKASLNLHAIRRLG